MSCYHSVSKWSILDKKLPEILFFLDISYFAILYSKLVTLMEINKKILLGNIREKLAISNKSVTLLIVIRGLTFIK